MSSFYSLIKREWLEHKAPFIWVPLIVSVLIVVFTVAFQNVTDEMVINTSEKSSQVIDGVVHTNESKRSVSMSEILLGDDPRRGSADVRGYFYLPLILIILLGLLNSTLDERKDGSILFFKSMPVSDSTTILSKYISMVWIAPLITLGCMLLLQLLFATWSSFNPSSWPQFAGSSVAGFFQYTTNTLVSYVLYGFWALPVFAWVMLVGAWASRGALLWVIGVPFGFKVIEAMASNTEYFQEALLRHLSPRLGVDLNTPAAGGELLAQVITLDFWLGVIIGLVLLALTVYCRRTRNEI
jgi:ABC-2 type transport system permease protein